MYKTEVKCNPINAKYICVPKGLKGQSPKCYLWSSLKGGTLGNYYLLHTASSIIIWILKSKHINDLYFKTFLKYITHKTIWRS